MFRAAHRSSSEALNCICSLWFIYPCGDRPLSRLSGVKYIYIYIYICVCVCVCVCVSAAARLLRSWVRIPPGHGCLSVVSVVCC